MKAIIRLMVLATLCISPLFADAQFEVKSIKNPEWFKPYVGKSLKQIKEMGFPVDSLKWPYPKIITWTVKAPRYKIYKGEHAGEYVFHFEKEYGSIPEEEAILYKISFYPQKPIEVYRDTCVTWFAHLKGKLFVATNIACDSIRWLYTSSHPDCPYSIYAVNRGDHIGRYMLFYKKEYGKPIQTAVLEKIEYADELDRFSKFKFDEVAIDHERLKQRAKNTGSLSPAETVWLKFWEVHIKNEVEKASKK